VTGVYRLLRFVWLTITIYKAELRMCRGILSRYSFKVAGNHAKTVISLLTLLNVLGGLSNYFVMVIVCLLGDCNKFLSTF
jgi:hypothetical protein